jgi:hypothetical protein
MSRTLGIGDTGVRRTVGVILVVALAVGFYGGLIYLKNFFVPIAFRILAVGLFLVLRRSKSQKAVGRIAEELSGPQPEDIDSLGKSLRGLGLIGLPSATV